MHEPVPILSPHVRLCGIEQRVCRDPVVAVAEQTEDSCNVSFQHTADTSTRHTTALRDRLTTNCMC